MATLVATPGSVTTWLNHWSLLHADWDSLAAVNRIGIDGTLLQMVLARRGATVNRSSADLVLPVVFSEVLPPQAPIAIIGAAPGVAKKVAERLAPRTVLAVNGYEELRDLRANPQALIDLNPALVILGLGAGLQDEVAKEISALLPQAAVCTAGGWIDQFAKKETYFPAWVHRFRLGWAWRIANEPRRLIGRYTTEAAVFLWQSKTLATRLLDLGTVGQWGIEVTPRQK